MGGKQHEIAERYHRHFQCFGNPEKMMEGSRHYKAKSNRHKAQDIFLAVLFVTKKNRDRKERDPEKEQHMCQVMTKMDDCKRRQN